MCLCYTVIFTKQPVFNTPNHRRSRICTVCRHFLWILSRWHQNAAIIQNGDITVTSRMFCTEDIWVIWHLDVWVNTQSRMNSDVGDDGKSQNFESRPISSIGKKLKNNNFRKILLGRLFPTVVCMLRRNWHVMGIFTHWDLKEREAQLPQRDSASATHVSLGSFTNRALHWAPHSLLYNYMYIID